ncbi:RNA polymerase sigma factor [Flavobacterium sp.]|uniref:RNA polymerase sigma factor n=1 Tax=Flavobacterium sp. TaxID=239 RepID=UPI003C650D92
MKTNLVRRLHEGDDSCFKEIYELYHFKVFSFVKKYTTQLADAEDVTQNVFIHLWKYRNALDTTIELESILFKSSKQEISRWYKKQNRIFSVEDKQLLKDLDRTDTEEESMNTKMESIESLLEQIPERRRKIFDLYTFEELSHKEIALKMDMSSSAVANQISKTVQFLKKNAVEHHELYWFAIMYAVHS